jgi:outer membrane protein
MIKNLFIYLAFFIAVCVVAYSQQDSISSLNLKKCIDISLKNNPQIKIAEANVKYNNATYTAAKSPLFPQLAFQSSWLRNGGTNFIGSNAINRTYSTYATGFQVNQFIYDFGKTYNKISSSEDFEKISEENYNTVKQNLILAVYSSYYNFLQTKRMRDIAKESLTQAEEHLRDANVRFQIGKAAQYDVIKANTDIENAKVNLIIAENNIKIGKLQLSNLMSVKLNDNVALEDNLETPQDSINLVQATEIAKQNRSEISANKYNIEACKALESSAISANYPSLNANAGYNWKSLDIAEKFNSSWNFGITFSLPIFQGFSLDAGIEQARANLESAKASLDYVIQNVLLDVQQEYSNFTSAKEKISASDNLVKQAEETLKLAEGRYKEGVGSPLEITDARLTLFNAKVIYIQSLYNYKITYASLLRAIGTLK